MTSIDYEVLYVAHVNHKDKLDERERELEKLRYKYVKILPTYILNTSKYYINLASGKNSIWLNFLLKLPIKIVFGALIFALAIF